MGKGSLVLATLLGITLLASLARTKPLPAVLLHQTGISGYSGNPTTGGATCITCHHGGVPPTTTLQGPLVVATGNQVSFSLVISGGQRKAGGLDVSITGGQFVLTDSGTQLMNGELTHIQPRNVDPAGNVTFFFDWVAPAVAGTYTLYAAGNSVNRDYSTTGDLSNKVSVDVTVKDATASFDRYGLGLAGSGGIVPKLNGIDGSADGNWSLKISRGLGGAAGWLVVGMGKAHLPFFGGTLYVDLANGGWLTPVQLGGVAGVPGDGDLDLAGVDVRDLLGMSLNFQAIILDPAAVRGLSLTYGSQMDVQ